MDSTNNSELLDELREMGIVVREHEAHVLRPSGGKDFRVARDLLDHAYFILDKRKASKMTSPIDFTTEDGRKGRIIPDEEMGMPGPSTKKILRGLEAHISEYVEVFGEYPTCLPIRIIDLAALLIHKEMSPGGSHAELALRCLQLLSKTIIEIDDDRFRVIDRLIESDRCSRVADDLYSYYFVVFSPQFLSGFKSDNVIIHTAKDYETVSGLYPVTLALYEKVMLESKGTKEGDMVEFGYEQFAENIGIKQVKYMSLIIKQLGASLDLLKNFKKISRWRIEKSNLSIQVWPSFDLKLK